MENAKPESLRIVLPLPNGLLSPNHTVGSMGGRFAKAGAIKKYRRLTREAVEAEQIETAPWKEITVKPTFFFKQNRERDEDNAIGSLKSAYDGIVDAGLVAKDDHKHMHRESPEFRIDKEHPRVELIIERLA